ncbi:zf-TFIIB domain-containing protein, partial [Arthrobacter sp. EH-1B-1]
MLCPVDKIELVMSERSGVEIDYCPTCRGVWLDRGELDKIIDRAGALTAQPAARPNPLNVSKAENGPGAQLELEALQSLVRGKEALWETLLALLDDG